MRAFQFATLILATFVMILSFALIAKAEEIPDYMKDGEIVVTLKDGRKYTFSTNEWKVVRRGSKAKEQPARLAETPETNRNRIRVLGGVGPSGGLNISSTPSSATISTDSGAVLGVGYDRLINDKLSVGGQIQTNDTVLINVGVDF